LNKIYTIPYSNTGLGGFLSLGGKRFHTPSWIEVEPDTTYDNLRVEKRPFDELFVEKRNDQHWKYKSASSDKEYTVRYNAAGDLSCDCWGYIGHRKCKHITETKKLCGI